MAVSYSLPPEEGLKTVALSGEISGVDKQLSGIEGGKRANLVIADGDILQASTRVRRYSSMADRKTVEQAHESSMSAREQLREVKEGLARWE